MNYDGNRSYTPRPMVKGSWKCAECGKEITELPFEPRPDSLDSLKCRDCFKSSRPERGQGGGRFHSDRGERKTYSGNWTCAECGTSITELPFMPDPSRVGALKCRDCHRKTLPDRY